MNIIKKDIETIVKNTNDLISFFENKTILITGGEGFLGKYFIEYFNHLNINFKIKVKLIIIDNYITGKKTKFSKEYKNFKFINHNIIKSFNVKRKIDLIIHAAGIASPFYYRKYPIETLDVSIIGTKNLLELSLKKKCKFIFFSSSEIYGDPTKGNVPTKETYRGNVNSIGPRACYDESKRVGETLCYIYGNYYKVHTNIIRPFNVYGPGMNKNDYRIIPNFFSKIIQNETVNIYGDGKQTRTYCYITDAISGFLRVAAYGNFSEVYNIGNNKPEISVLDLIKLIKKVSNKNIKFKISSYPITYPDDEPLRRCPNISKAKKDLRYLPHIQLEDGLKKFYEWALSSYK